MDNAYIIVGKLGKTRGLNGELYITTFTDFPDRFLDMKSIFVKNRNGWETKSIVSSRLISDRPVIKFEGINTNEAAALWTNRELAVLKEELVELPDNSFYIFDLIDCEVLDEIDNSVVGKIVDVQQLPANDAYLIETIEGKRILFPAVKQFVKQVDIDNKKVYIDQAGIMKD